MRMSVGVGPFRFYSGHSRQHRIPLKPTLVTFIVWLMLCVAGTIWIGTQDASLTFPAIVAAIIVSIKILATK